MITEVLPDNFFPVTMFKQAYIPTDSHIYIGIPLFEDQNVKMLKIKVLYQKTQKFYLIYFFLFASPFPKISSIHLRKSPFQLRKYTCQNILICLIQPPFVYVILHIKMPFVCFFSYLPLSLINLVSSVVKRKQKFLLY